MLSFQNGVDYCFNPGTAAHTIMQERVLSLQRKKVADAGLGLRGGVNKNSRAPRWFAGVSADGELVLRRCDSGDPQVEGHIKYSFAQGLTFVARRWRNVMNDDLLEFGQSHVRWGTLYWIAIFGDRVNQTQLAARMGIEQPTLGRVLRELEADGLIERHAPAGDRRARVISLTAASKPLMRKINRIQNTVRASLLEGIEPAELASCLTVFARILENAERHSAKRR